MNNIKWNKELLNKAKVHFGNRIYAHPFWFFWKITLLLGIAISVVKSIWDWSFSYLLAAPFIAVLFIYPCVLTLVQFASIFIVQDDELYRSGKIYDIVTIFLGINYSLMYMAFMNVKWDADWQTTLINHQVHSPIQMESALTLWVILVLGSLAYFVLNYSSVETKAPLVTVLCISAMYLSTGIAIAWAIHSFTARGNIEVLLPLLPINCVFITIKTVRRKVFEWKRMGTDSEIQLGKAAWVQSCNRMLLNSDKWPIAAFLLMWPLLGIIIGVLLLFGQEPTAVIKAFTETSDWTLSQRVAPQNVFVDEHYLCTVAAGGHHKVVRPKRMGIRHGHAVIVNRQLCIANAFEQILEEKTPGFHRVVRSFYDKYGFPVAKCIRHKWSADVVYFIMKPLEWIFWVVLYLTEVNPENRIAIQYTGKSLKDFQ